MISRFPVLFFFSAAQYGPPVFGQVYCNRSHFLTFTVMTQIPSPEWKNNRDYCIVIQNVLFLHPGSMTQ